VGRQCEGVHDARACLLGVCGHVFEAARTREGFAKVDLETGTVIWPGGADLAPDTLYEEG